jgi:histone H1/5
MPSKNDKKVAPKLKHSYLEMITNAIFNLQERKGSSRDAIWKYLQMQFPDSIRDKKIYLVQLRRIALMGLQVKKSENNTGRFKLDTNFRTRYIKHLAKGESPHLAQTHAMTTKTNNKRKPASKNAKTKMSKTAKGKAAITKAKNKAATKAKNKKNASKPGRPSKEAGAKSKKAASRDTKKKLDKKGVKA